MIDSGDYEEPQKRKEKRERLFLKLSFFLPIVFPGVLFLLFHSERVSLNGWGIAYLVIIYSVGIAGIPYLIFLIGLFVWMRGKSANEIAMVTWFAPLYGAGVFLCCAFLLFLIQLFTPTNGRSNTEFISGAFALSFLVVIFGYAYVLVVNAGFYFFRQLMLRLDPADDDIAPTNLW